MFGSSLSATINVKRVDLPKPNKGKTTEYRCDKAEEIELLRIPHMGAILIRHTYTHDKDPWGWTESGSWGRNQTYQRTLELEIGKRLLGQIVDTALGMGIAGDETSRSLRAMRKRLESALSELSKLEEGTESCP